MALNGMEMVLLTRLGSYMAVKAAVVTMRAPMEKPGRRVGWCRMATAYVKMTPSSLQHPW